MHGNCYLFNFQCGQSCCSCAKLHEQCSLPVWQAGEAGDRDRDRGRATGGGRDRASVVVCLCSSLSLPSFFYLPPSPCVSERGRRSEESHTNAIKLALGQINCSQRKWQATSKEGETRRVFHCSAAAIKHTYNTGNGSGHESATHTHTCTRTRKATNQHVAIKS